MPQKHPAPTVFVTADAVKQSLGLGKYDIVDDAWLSIVVDAVNDFVRRHRRDLTRPECTCGVYAAYGSPYRAADYEPNDYQTTVSDTTTHAADCLHLVHRVEPSVVLGAVMLSQRLYSRRNASEVAGYAEMGGSPSLDRDIATLLKLGWHYRPVVA